MDKLATLPALIGGGSGVGDGEGRTVSVAVSIISVPAGSTLAPSGIFVAGEQALRRITAAIRGKRGFIVCKLSCSSMMARSSMVIAFGKAQEGLEPLDLRGSDGQQKAS